eukprot:6654921-Ditylum_brightwellii.AAC.1
MFSRNVHHKLENRLSFAGMFSLGSGFTVFGETPRCQIYHDWMPTRCRPSGRIQLLGSDVGWALLPILLAIRMPPETEVACLFN